MLSELYIVIPTINGEISGYPYLFKTLDHMLHNFSGECTIYHIDLEDYTIYEVLDLVL